MPPLSPKQYIAPGLALLTILIAGIFAWQQGTTPSSGVAASQGTPGQRHQRIATESPLSIHFASPMDEDSVAEHITIDPPVEGEAQWKDAQTMLFQPSAALTLSGTYTVTVDPQAERRDRAVLGESVVIRYFVAGSPAVVQQIPPPGSDTVSPNQPVTIVFDRPMVPLTTISERGMQLAEWPVTVTPPLEGTWKWLSTTTAEFAPRKGFAPGTEYRVSVPAGIGSVQGEKTTQDFSWTFSTRRPKWVRSEPPMDYMSASPKAEMVITFNQDIDLESAKQHILLVRSEVGRLQEAQLAAMRDASPDPKIATIVPAKIVYGKKEVDGKQVTDAATLVVIPSSSLTLNTWHAVIVDDGVMSPGGSMGTAEANVIQFRTAEPMEVQSVRQEYGAIVLTFNNPYDASTIKKGVTITPKPEGWDNLTIEENLWDGTSLYLYPTLEPSTTYTVETNTNLKDQFGQSAASPKKLSFTTDKLAPRVFIHSSGTFGVFEQGFPPVYYLNGVNVKTMDVKFAKFSLPEFLAEQKAGYNDWQHVPALEGKDMLKSWTLTPGSKENEWKSIPFDLEEKLGASLPSGIYALTLTAPEYRDPYANRQTTEKIFFTVSNTALTFKWSGHQALVWAVNMKDGTPVVGAEIALHDLNGNTLATGKTDSEGFYETAIDAAAFGVDGNTWSPEIWVTSTTPDDFAFVGSTWMSGMGPYDFGATEDWVANKEGLSMLSYIYTDRPIYRAGDEVQFKGILRLKDKFGVLHPPKSARSAQVRIDDAEGNTVFSQAMPINAFGSFNGKLPLDPKASLGTYWINVELEPGTDVSGNWSTATFQVLAYRKPEYRVEVDFENEQYFAGDTVNATIEGSYYFGMPMDEAKVSWRAMSTDYFFNRYTDGWYSFSLQEDWCWYDCERESEIISSGEGSLASDGTFRITVPVPMEEEPLSQVLSIDADITDSSNQVVSTRASVPVHKASVYVGIRTAEYSVQPGDDVTAQLVTVDTEGNPMGGQRVNLSLYTRSWNSNRKKGVDGQYYYDNEKQDTFVSSFSATTGGDGKAEAKVRIPAGGQYVILAKVRDSGGRETQSDTSVYAWSSTYVNWPRTNSNRMTVVADKPEYKVGETAKLLVQTPFQGENVRALVTIEREGLIRRTVIPVESSAQSIDIPITDDLIPNAYVSVIVMKPRMGETFNEHGLDTGAPAFRIGYTKLKVENKSKGLTVSVLPDKRRYVPGEQVTVIIATEDSTGKPVPAEVSLSAVDMSVLALTGFELPNLLSKFYSDRGLGVRTAVNLLYLLERFKPGSKGGGGGDGEEKARGTFKDTAYWNPMIKTDDAGRATVSFKLPDNLTTWQLLAIAHTPNSLVGSEATEILETKHVIVRPVRPRFAVHGDRAELAAIVHNGTEENQKFTVSLSGKGFEGGRDAQTVTIPAEGQQKVIFPVTFGYSSQAEFVFKAEGETGRDEIHEAIPLHPFGIPQSTATSGFTDESVTEQIFVPVRSEVTALTATATLSPTLATYLPKSLDYLVQFPYGCAEQTVSSYLPNIAVAKLKGFDAFKVVTDEELKEKITAGIERLLTFQQSDGGFGYWQGSAESYPYLSAYILHALHQTREAGYTVDAGVIDRTRAYLQQTLSGGTGKRTPYDDSQRAYILYVLGETGSPDESLLSNLYGNRDELGIFAKAYLAMSFEKAGDHRRASSLLQEILAEAKVSPRGVHFEEKNGWWFRVYMNTDSRTNAIVLQAIMRIEPNNALAPRIVRSMLAMRRNGHWDTTQSTTASIFALVDYLKFTRELEGDFAATVAVDDEEIGKAIFDAGNILTKEEMMIPADALEPGQFNDVVMGKEGHGRLYYDLLLSYFWKAREILPAEEGISIVREITPVEGSAARPTVGGTYKVKLTITVPEDRHFVAVESPHPAGFEGIDFALKTSQQHLEDEIKDDDDPYWWWDSSWYFNHKEFRDDQVFLFADELPSGVYTYEYLARATLPGTFLWRPARAYEMYFPEVFGNTESAVMEIRDIQQ